MCKVSIIIPIYNQSHLLREAIESVLKQRFSDFEILVVDDGSTDQTESTVQSFSDPRIRYFHISNGGPSGARNYELQKAKGEFISFLDDDHMYKPSFLEIMVGELQKFPKYGLAYCQYKTIHTNGIKQKDPGTKEYFTGRLLKDSNGRFPCIILPSIIYRHSILKDTFYDELLKDTDDFDFNLRLATKALFLYVPRELVYRRITKNGVSQNATKDFSVNSILAPERFYNHFNDPQVIPPKLIKNLIARECRAQFRRHYHSGNRKAALQIIRFLMKYFPFHQRYYRKWFVTLFLSRKKDTMPDWKMPKSLPPYIVALGKKIQYSV